MKISDRLFGLFFLLLGLALALYGFTVPAMPGQAYGAGLFPIAVGGFLSLGGVVLGFSGWQRRTVEPVLAPSDWLRSPAHLINVVMTIACILAFALAIKTVGFAVLTFFTIAVLLTRFGQAWWRAGLIALVAAAAFQYLFVSLMRVPLPPGLLQGLIY